MEQEVKEVGIHQVCGQGLDQLLEKESLLKHNLCMHPTVAHTTNANIDQTTTHTPHILMHTQAQEMSISPETLRLEQSKDLRLRTLNEWESLHHCSPGFPH